jgi:hypothetical protein
MMVNRLPRKSSKRCIVNQLAQLKQIEAAEVGTTRHDINDVKYNTAYYGHRVHGDPQHPEAFAWCVVFQWWCFQKAGIPTSVFPKSNNVFAVRDWFKDRGRFYHSPMVGDLVIFARSHIGFVEKILANNRIQLAFFQPEQLIKMLGAAPTLAGTEKVDGAEYDVLEVAPAPGAKIRLFIARDSSLLSRIDQVSGEGAAAQTQTMSIKNVRPNAVLADALFKWTPPKSAQAYEAPDFEKSLIAVGKTAPDFDLSRPGGGRLALSTTLQGKKATLVNFWFYG